MALSVPLSRFTPGVGGGSAFYVRLQYRMAKYKWTITGESGTHSVCLKHAYLSGSASVLVDESVIYQRPRRWLDHGFEHEFYIDGIICLVRLDIDEDNLFKFRCRLWTDGKLAEAA